MSKKIIPFDMVDFLDSEEAFQEYFRQVMEDGDPNEIIRTLGYIAKARGMMKLAEDTGLVRDSLYRSLSDGEKPRFETIMKVIQALGLKLTVSPA